MHNSNSSSKMSNKNTHQFDKISWIISHRKKRSQTAINLDTHKINYGNIKLQGNHNKKILKHEKHRRTATDKLKQDLKQNKNINKISYEQILKQLVPTIQKYVNVIINDRMLIFQQKIQQKINKLSKDIIQPYHNLIEAFQEEKIKRNSIVNQDIQSALREQLTQRYIELEEKWMRLTGQLHKMKLVIGQPDQQIKQNISNSNLSSLKNEKQNLKTTKVLHLKTTIFEIVETYNQNFKEISEKICTMQKIMSHFISNIKNEQNDEIN